MMIAPEVPEAEEIEDRQGPSVVMALEHVREVHQGCATKASREEAIVVVDEAGMRRMHIHVPGALDFRNKWSGAASNTTMVTTSIFGLKIRILSLSHTPLSPLSKTPFDQGRLAAGLYSPFDRSGFATRASRCLGRGTPWTSRVVRNAETLRSNVLHGTLYLNTSPPPVGCGIARALGLVVHIPLI